jgi:phosphate butyryltransferase
MPNTTQNFSDIQHYAAGLYKKSPCNILTIPIDNQEIRGALEEAQSGGWMMMTEIASTSGTSQPDVSALEEAVTSLASGEGDVLLSYTLDPVPLLSTLLRADLGLRKEGETWSHVAVFEWQKPPRWLLVSDGVLVTRPDLTRRIGVIHNTVRVAERLGVHNPHVALLAASRAIQQDVPTSREWSWVSKMAERRIFRGAKIRGPVGLEDAVNPPGIGMQDMAEPKRSAGNSLGWVDVLITADISVGNPLVSALALLCGLPCAGVVVGGDVPVVLPWPTVDRNSVLTSLALAALISPRGRRRIFGKWEDAH